MSFRRMLPFLFLNIIVSATVVLLILWWWDGRNQVFEPAEEVIGEVAPIADVIAEPTPTPESELGSADTTQLEEPAGPTVHIVGAGDTLGVISVEYDVPIDEIMEANGMDNPNFLFVGQELIIPVAGEPLPTSEPAAEDVVASERPTPIPTEPAAAGDSVIEIDQVIGQGELPLEAIQIINNGSSQATLSGWYLTDQGTNTYTFGQVTLFGDGAGILLHTMAGRDSATDLFWGLEEPLWESGDTAVLYDDSGAVRAQFQIP